ncbi:response regulator [Agrobacterium sp. ES01]|uniref:response regulator n=1 Tax=Agrobacterium sp. ES01 TaxID=3420714 RepID=UPI003D141A81
MKSPLVVLVVEDEPLLRMDIACDLEDRGMDVLEAANANEAITILQENRKVGALFTDVDMPGSMDGLGLAATVRDRWPPIKIIVTSGHRQVTSSQMPNGSRFFGKPYNSDEVANALLEMSA